MAMISLNKLTKKFGNFTAVDDVSFDVNEGEIFGFLGPNGAGKTTTISMLATLSQPTSGSATVNGFNILTQQNEVRKSIGVVFQDQSLDDELTGYENLDIHGRLYSVPVAERKKRIAELLKLVGLEDRQKDLVRTYSGGMRRRLEIARGLLHEPRVLFLDEPTIGLDPQTRNHLWEYISAINKNKKVTIILTTHYMEEADRLCDRIAIIDHGKIIALDTSENLKRSVGGGFISVKTKKQNELVQELARAKWSSGVKQHDGTLSIKADRPAYRISDLVKLAQESNITLEHISVHTPTLEDVFLHVTGKTIREEESGGKETMRLVRRAWRR
jgi:ABC-2 type transport system ATP-binding protein